MIGAMFESTTIPVLEQVVSFAQARHGILAGNVANMDTPGYRVRDLSVKEFQSRLKEAIEVRNERGTSVTSGDATEYGDKEMRAVRDSIEGILYHDGSNDSIEQQVAEITKNQNMHNTAITILTSQYRMLQTAISERV